MGAEIKTNLRTSDGRLVAHITIPPFNKNPEVLVWGERFFVRHGSGYFEAFTYFIPNERMVNPMGDAVAYINLFKSAQDDQYYANVIGHNNEVMWTTEGHKNQVDLIDLCERTFTGVKINFITEAQ